MIKIKSLLFVMLLMSSLQFAGCKSKPKENAETPQSTTVDSSASAPAGSVTVSPDDQLQTGLKDATKDYPDVKAEVINGEVTLTGNITRDKLTNLLQSVNSLHPKKINNNLTIK